MKENNGNSLCSSKEICIAGLNVLIGFELKSNFTDSTLWNTGETGDIHRQSLVKTFQVNYFSFQLWVRQSNAGNSKRDCVLMIYCVLNNNTFKLF